MALKELPRSTHSIIRAFKRPDFTVTETPLSSFAVRASAPSISSRYASAAPSNVSGDPRVTAPRKLDSIRPHPALGCTSAASSGGNETLTASQGMEAGGEAGGAPSTQHVQFTLSSIYRQGNASMQDAAAWDGC